MRNTDEMNRHGETSLMGGDVGVGVGVGDGLADFCGLCNVFVTTT